MIPEAMLSTANSRTSQGKLVLRGQSKIHLDSQLVHMRILDLEKAESSWLGLMIVPISE